MVLAQEQMSSPKFLYFGKFYLKLLPLSFFIFIFGGGGAMLPGLQNHSSLTKDWTYIPYSGSTEPSHWTNREFPWCSFLLGMPFTFDILVASNSTWIFFSHPSFATSPTSWCWLYLKLHWGPSCLTDLGQFPLLHALTILFLCSEIIILAVFTHSRVELIRVCPHLAPDSIIPWAWTSAPLSYPTTQGSVWSKAGTED